MKKNVTLPKFDKKRLLREQDHLTRPPRLEGAVKEEKKVPARKGGNIGNGVAPSMGHGSREK